MHHLVDNSLYHVAVITANIELKTLILMCKINLDYDMYVKINMVNAQDSSASSRSSKPLDVSVIGFKLCEVPFLSCNL